MGLKDVLAKMRLVELDEAAQPRAPGPSRAAAPPAARSPRPARPDSGDAPAPAQDSLPAPARQPGGARGGAETIEDILASLPRDPPRVDEAALQASPGVPDGLADFEAIYQAAGIRPPPHGFTAPKVLEILGSSAMAQLDAKARAGALAAFLEMNPAGRVSLRDVVEDAVRRDEALDAYERALVAKVDVEGQAADQENQRLQAEIDELARRNQERMRANLEAVAASRNRLAEWQLAKRAEERRLFEAVAPFVEANPVSLGSVAPGAQPPDGS